MYAILRVARRELDYLLTRPIYLFGIIGAPLLVTLLLLYLMGSGLPTNMPVAVVDEDQSAPSRALVRNLDIFQSSEVVLKCSSMNEALRAMRQGKVYEGYKQKLDQLANLSSTTIPIVAI